MDNLDTVIEFLPFLIPLVLLQFGLMIYAIVHILKHPTYKFGNRTMWLIIVIFVNLIGPIVYLMFGKED